VGTTTRYNAVLLSRCRARANVNFSLEGANVTLIKVMSGFSQLFAFDCVEMVDLLLLPKLHLYVFNVSCLRFQIMIMYLCKLCSC